MQGLEVRDDGTPAWLELHTRAYDASVAFYRDVFGWDAHVASDTPELRYTTPRERARAGWPGSWPPARSCPRVRRPPGRSTFSSTTRTPRWPGSPSWADQVVQGGEDTPYGRLATAADPTGVRIQAPRPKLTT